VDGTNFSCVFFIRLSLLLRYHFVCINPFFIYVNLRKQLVSRENRFSRQKSHGKIKLL